MSASVFGPSATNARGRVGANRNYNEPPIDITKDELARISDALKKEEFRKLFVEYCDDIQDPENRKIFEKEITQLEAERGVHVRFINPQPGFVVKTSVNREHKCFVNIAMSEEVAKPTSQPCNDATDGSRGLSWSLPMAQSPPRNDVDNRGKICHVYDVVFHPDAHHLAQRNSAFRKCLIETALDAVEREFKVQLDRTNLKFPKLEFKGMARPTVIRKLMRTPPSTSQEPHPLETMYPPMPTADDDTPPNVVPAKATPVPPPEFATPKHTIKYVRDMDLSECTNAPDAKLDVTVPQQLVVEIELPLLRSTAECQLDVTPQTLYLLSEKAGAKYRLQVELPYAVNDQEGTAHYDVDTRRLRITLPVVRRNVDEQRKMHDLLLKGNDGDEMVVAIDANDDHHQQDSNHIGDGIVQQNVMETKEGEVQEDEEDDDDDDDDNDTDANKEIAKDDEDDEHEDIDAVAEDTSTFLLPTIHYQFPADFEFKCDDDNVVSLLLRVANVQPDSVATRQLERSLHVRCTSLGAGFYPTHYAFFLQLPSQCTFALEIAVHVQIADDHLVVRSKCATAIDELRSYYFAGPNPDELTEFSMKAAAVDGGDGGGGGGGDCDDDDGDAAEVACCDDSADECYPQGDGGGDVADNESSPSSSFDGQTTKGNEGDAKGDNNNNNDDDDADGPPICTTVAINTTEDEDTPHAPKVQNKKLSKKQKKKNKKRRSLSESTYADIKAYEASQGHDGANLSTGASTMIVGAGSRRPAVGIASATYYATTTDNATMPTLDKDTTTTTTASMAVPGGQQQRKQRSYSESRDSAIGSGSHHNTAFKSILKRYSRYDPRPSISDSSSSIDDCLSLSHSVDAGVGSSLRFSQSFSDIPEENVNAELSESHKKTVRFSEVIKKQLFRLDSSILGQRKKNQKRRNQKQRALQRCLSEGDSVDYEELLQPISSKSNGNSLYFVPKNGQEDKDYEDDYKARGDGIDKQFARQPLLRSTNVDKKIDADSDNDANKVSMIFEMDM